MLLARGLVPEGRVLSITTLLGSVAVAVLSSAVVVVTASVRDVTGWVVVVDNVEFVGLTTATTTSGDVVVVVAFCGSGQAYDPIRPEMMTAVSRCILEPVMAVAMTWKP